MKNLKITKHIKTKIIPFVLTGTMILPLTGCSPTSNKEETETKVYEGILTVGDEKFLIKYSDIEGYVYNDRVEVTLIDGTKLVISRDNFYEYDENSETMQKIKKLVIEEDHVIE